MHILRLPIIVTVIFAWTNVAHAQDYMWTPGLDTAYSNSTFGSDYSDDEYAEFEDGSDEFPEDVSRGDSPEAQKAQRVLDEYLSNVRAEGIEPNQDVIEILIGNGAVMPD